MAASEAATRSLFVPADNLTRALKNGSKRGSIDDLSDSASSATKYTAETAKVVRKLNIFVAHKMGD